MLITSIEGRAAPQKRQQKEQSPELKSIFNTVDLFKTTLTNCGKGLEHSSIRPFECSRNYFYMLWKDEGKLVNVGFYYDPTKQTLSMKNGSKQLKEILKRVTDFYFSYFASSNSVLYRLEINNKEQIRGYIYLVNMANKNLKEEHNEQKNFRT